MTQTILLGTYTKKDSKGIYSIQLDTQKKSLDLLKEEAHIGNPTYLDGTDDLSLLFSVAKTEDKGGIASFRKGELGNYLAMDTFMEEGAPPCYVAYDSDRELVYTANYHTGEVAVFSTNSEGELTLVDKVKHSGSSVHDNQKGPHAHYFDLTPDKDFLVACDLGTDEVITYSLTMDHKLQPVASVKMPAGTGPRHIVFHPQKPYAYVMGELSSEVVVLSYDKDEGRFDSIQTITSIPEDHTGFNGAAAIRMSSDGKFLYASNRGHDSLVVYAIKENGTLELVEYVPTEGKTPRDFNLDPSEQFIVVAHQDTDNLTLFERNKADGTLTMLQKDVYAPEVICVTFKK
ncbi:lactonase family protein [Alkalibacterium sp. MB6]|uniref:lactonase family protein n=1 Tax=Alkalibacterium sp. MB6 TaxID=2081965 RepID=UPI00137A605A|nr:lactonase family protein [Alkalibacterium sp. MB6]